MSKGSGGAGPHGLGPLSPRAPVVISPRVLTAAPPAQADATLQEPTLNLAAEPVRWFDIERFYAVFENSGLPRGVVYPTYGLAEHTVFVCTNGSQVERGCQRGVF